jgi:hypothetical protein
MPETMHATHILWSRMLFDRLADGGSWGVPRSGLIFRKSGDRFNLAVRMPWDASMEGTITREQLIDYQRKDYEDIKRHFEAAGITVGDVSHG